MASLCPHYPLVISHSKLENHHFQWKKSIKIHYQWPFPLVMLIYQRVNPIKSPLNIIKPAFSYGKTQGSVSSHNVLQRFDQGPAACSQSCRRSCTACCPSSPRIPEKSTMAAVFFPNEGVVKHHEIWWKTSICPMVFL